MNKTDYLYMILDNVLVFNINLPSEFQGNGLSEHLNKFDEFGLKAIAGFNKNFLEQVTGWVEHGKDHPMGIPKRLFDRVGGNRRDLLLIRRDR